MIYKKSIIVINLIIGFISFSFGENVLYDTKFNKNILYIGVPSLAISFFLDKKIDEFVKHNKSKSQNTIWESITYLGSPYIIGLGTAGYMYGYFSKNSKLLQSSVLATQSSVISAVIVIPIKYITKRKRPSKEDNLSFPSAHSAIAFAFWGSYAQEYNEGIKKYILWSIPFFVAYSRLYLEKHWLSDVVAGGLIGVSSIYLAKKLTNFLSIRYNINIFIDISSNKAGIIYIF